MSKAKHTAKQIAAATKTIFKVEDKQRATWFCLGATLVLIVWFASLK